MLFFSSASSTTSVLTNSARGEAVAFFVWCVILETQAKGTLDNHIDQYPIGNIFLNPPPVVVL